LDKGDYKEVFVIDICCLEDKKDKLKEGFGRAIYLIFPHPVSQLLYDIFKYPSLPMDKRGDGLIWNRLIYYGAF
jgi:hypothetical protein